MIAVLKILAGLIVGGILPSIGGHGQASFSQAAPFMFVGGLIGGVFACFSLLTVKFLTRKNKMANIYVYGWCAIIIVFGLVLGILGIPLIVIGFIVLFTKRAQLAKSLSNQ